MGSPYKLPKLVLRYCKRPVESDGWMTRDKKKRETVLDSLVVGRIFFASEVPDGKSTVFEHGQCLSYMREDGDNNEQSFIHTVSDIGILRRVAREGRIHEGFRGQPTKRNGTTHRPPPTGGAAGVRSKPLEASNTALGRGSSLFSAFSLPSLLLLLSPVEG